MTATRIEPKASRGHKIRYLCQTNVLLQDRRWGPVEAFAWLQNCRKESYLTQVTSDWNGGELCGRPDDWHPTRRNRSRPGVEKTHKHVSAMQVCDKPYLAEVRNAVREIRKLPPRMAPISVHHSRRLEAYRATFTAIERAIATGRLTPENVTPDLIRSYAPGADPLFCRIEGCGAVAALGWHSKKGQPLAVCTENPSHRADVVTREDLSRAVHEAYPKCWRCKEPLQTYKESLQAGILRLHIYYCRLCRMPTPLPFKFDPEEYMRHIEKGTIEEYLANGRQASGWNFLPEPSPYPQPPTLSANQAELQRVRSKLLTVDRDTLVSRGLAPDDDAILIRLRVSEDATTRPTKSKKFYVQWAQGVLGIEETVARRKVNKAFKMFGMDRPRPHDDEAIKADMLNIMRADKANGVLKRASEYMDDLKRLYPAYAASSEHGPTLRLYRLHSQV